MVPFWIWLSKITINQEMDKNSCVQYCSEQNAKLVTVGHLEYASEFQVPQSKLLVANYLGFAR